MHFSPWQLDNVVDWDAWASGHSVPFFDVIARALLLGTLTEEEAVARLDEEVLAAGLFVNLVPVVSKGEQPDGNSSAPRGPARARAEASTRAALLRVLLERLLRAALVFGAPAADAWIAEATTAYGAPFVATPYALRIACELSRAAGGDGLESFAGLACCISAERGGLRIYNANAAADDDAAAADDDDDGGGGGGTMFALATTHHVSSMDRPSVWGPMTSPMDGASADARYAVARRLSNQNSKLLAAAMGCIFAYARGGVYNLGAFLDDFGAVDEATALAYRWMCPQLRVLSGAAIKARIEVGELEELASARVLTRSGHVELADALAALETRADEAEREFEAHRVGGSHALQQQRADVIAAERAAASPAQKRAAARLRDEFEEARAARNRACAHSGAQVDRLAVADAAGAAASAAEASAAARPRSSVLQEKAETLRAAAGRAERDADLFHAPSAALEVLLEEVLQQEALAGQPRATRAERAEAAVLRADAVRMREEYDAAHAKCLDDRGIVYARDARGDIVLDADGDPVVVASGTAGYGLKGASQAALPRRPRAPTPTPTPRQPPLRATQPHPLPNPRSLRINLLLMPVFFFINR